jgi:SAM-dependent methyltransferase
MKYTCYQKKEKNPQQGGSYWEESDFGEHLNLISFQTTYKYLLQNYPPPFKILEAGCGIGRWLIPLAEQGYDVTGIEIDDRAVNIVKKNYSAPNMTVLQGDIFNMDFLDKTFDMVLSLGVLEHFEYQDIQRSGILEHIRVLKDDGVLLITVPHFSILRMVSHFPYLLVMKVVRRLKKKEYFFAEYRYTQGEFKRILAACNLKVESVVYDELSEPYSFGLTIDFPVNRLFRTSDGTEYKLNWFGKLIYKITWKIHPGLVSGCIGFVCKKNL